MAAPHPPTFCMLMLAFPSVLAGKGGGREGNRYFLQWWQIMKSIEPFCPEIVTIYLPFSLPQTRCLFVISNIEAFLRINLFFFFFFLFLFLFSFFPGEGLAMRFVAHLALSSFLEPRFIVGSKGCLNRSISNGLFI